MAAVENVIVQGLFCVWLIQILDGGCDSGRNSIRSYVVILIVAFSDVAQFRERDRLRGYLQEVFNY